MAAETQNLQTRIQQLEGITIGYVDSTRLTYLVKSYARQAHQEFCKENPSSSWADLDVIWSVIPAREKEAVVDRLDELYKLAGVFTSRTEVVESGYEQRLNLARAAWLQEKRKKRSESLMVEAIEANTLLGEEASGPSRPGA